MALDEGFSGETAGVCGVAEAGGVSWAQSEYAENAKNSNRETLKSRRHNGFR